ncbi:MAG: glycosyltransferase family 2 protein [Nitrosarchaeum sp.]|uniref:glycosyltransferase family 2 protein n=1 Tax=Nitrosarchaeum sp. TaxID=2026886 RepID=UPI002DF0E8DC|nr:glycosyltransferase family 2 protein [Nitrosarchaeum sp.]
MINLKITVGIPAYNEEKNIASIIENLSKIADTVIVCNDGSSDNTGRIAEKMGAIVINHERNLGYGGAIRSLFLKARELESDVLVTMDSDGQHRISDVLPVAEPITKNQADLVIGSRFLEGNQENIPKYRKIGIKMITKLANASLEESVTDSQSGFRAYSKNVLLTITPSEQGMGVSNEILMKASKSGFKIAEVPIVVSYEGKTSTQHPVSHGVSVTLSTLKFISIEHPLKFYGIPGLIFFGIGLIFTIMTIQGFTETRQILLSAAVIGVGTIIFGTVLLMTSIILYSIVNLVRENSSK